MLSTLKRGRRSAIVKKLILFFLKFQGSIKFKMTLSIKKKILGGEVVLFTSLSESVSGASSNDQLLRTGTHFEINYLKD